MNSERDAAMREAKERSVKSDAAVEGAAKANSEAMTKLSDLRENLRQLRQKRAKASARTHHDARVPGLP